MAHRNVVPVMGFWSPGRHVARDRRQVLGADRCGSVCCADPKLARCSATCEGSTRRPHATWSGSQRTRYSTPASNDSVRNERIGQARNGDLMTLSRPFVELLGPAGTRRARTVRATLNDCARPSSPRRTSLPKRCAAISGASDPSVAPPAVTDCGGDVITGVRSGQ